MEADLMFEFLTGSFTTETGGLNPLIWVIAGLVAIFSIAFVYLIMAFIVPAKNSPARHFIKAKREKKPVLILDCGKYFRCVVGDQEVGKEKAQIFRHEQDIIKGEQGLKYCEGVMTGIGENFRSLLVNVAIIDLMDMINKKDWTPEEVTDRLEKLSALLKNELGFRDEVKVLDEEHAKSVAVTNAEFDAKRAEIITTHMLPPADSEEIESDEGTNNDQ